jgi:ribosomal-protein-alanine N-acetyltransferase
MHQLFSTERLIVRRYSSADVENFFSLNGDEEIMRYIRPAQNRQDSERFLIENIEFYNDYPLMGRWAVEEKHTRKFVGSFAIIFIPNTDLIQLGYSLKKEEWGKGYATELSKAGLKYVFEVMKLPLIYAITEAENIASQKVLLKVGFKEESRYLEGDKHVVRYIKLSESLY